MSDPIKAALKAAAKRLCICDGECFETRHGMMNGPCEAMIGQAAAAIAAFLRALDDGAVLRLMSAEEDRHKGWRDILADAVERATKGGGDA